MTTIITQANIDELLDSGRLEVAMRNGRWWQLRRNGQTKQWKRDPERFRIPVKAGLRCYGAIGTEPGDMRLYDQGKLFRVMD